MMEKSAAKKVLAKSFKRGLSSEERELLRYHARHGTKILCDDFASYFVAGEVEVSRQGEVAGGA